MNLDRETLRHDLAQLAGQNIFVGTSSWKYPGWLGQIYTPEKYHYRGKLAKTRFEKDCLAEYSQVFKTVCVDAAYYTFPSPQYLQGLAGQVPGDFRFSFKVTDAITIKRFPNQARFGARGGQDNPDFLNPDLFTRAFLRPLESIRDQVGIVMFEFSKFFKTDFASEAAFVAVLDPFLAALPPGWRYGVEMRNKTWLGAEYFSCLAKHQVTHVFNSWSDMPSVADQRAMAGSVTRPDCVAARFLTAPGRTYSDSVDTFEPYAEIQEVNEDARAAAAGLLAGSLREKRGGTYIYVNNRLEGNAPSTIAAILQRLKDRESPRG